MYTVGSCQLALGLQQRLHGHYESSHADLSSRLKTHFIAAIFLLFLSQGHTWSYPAKECFQHLDWQVRVSSIVTKTSPTLNGFRGHLDHLFWLLFFFEASFPFLSVAEGGRWVGALHSFLTLAFFLSSPAMSSIHDDKPRSCSATGPRTAIPWSNLLNTI